jgi:histidine triad (HIT) family protein
MTTNTSHVEDCIFCKIINKTIPSTTVYEDANFIGILDIHPMSPGHTLIIPKTHYRWVWDIPNAGPFFEVVKKIALAQKKAFSTDFIISKIVGDEVHHAHMWVYPGEKVTGERTDFKTNAEKIIKNL